MRYIVVARHRSEYPKPIQFAKGCLIAIGEKYEGPEGWDNWYLCRTPDSQEGWVPGQIIEHLEPGSGKALEDYTALELDVDAGDVLIGSRTLNGWAWCNRPADAGSGWVPLKNLRETGND
ncbi:MAG: SH3 domain-containing protein [Achromobacter sp.]